MAVSFEIELLDVLAGNRSVVDLPRLYLKNKVEADEFLFAYGFDLNLDEDRKKILYYYRRALVFLLEKWNVEESSLPEILLTPEKHTYLGQILLWASGTLEADLDLKLIQSPLVLKKWSCVLLRVMHAFIHAENDLFHLYSQEIQNQILTPIQNAVVMEASRGQSFLRRKSGELCVGVTHFEVKPHKTSVSSVTKLLSKAETHMININDKVGVRFVTQTVREALQVLQFLVSEHLVSVAHVMAGQTTNSLYPIALLRQISTEYPKWQELDNEQLEFFLQDFYKKHNGTVQEVKKENAFSVSGYQFIKFVVRRLIRLPQKGGQFFYPYEIQIMTEKAYQMSQEGEGDHRLYKQRQLEAAKKRVLDQ